MVMKYELTKSRRKSITISIRDGAVYVRAPLNASQGMIDNFVRSKKNWIEKHVTKQQDEKRKRTEFDLNMESHILFLGKEIPIADVLSCSNNEETLLKDLKNFYINEAQKIIKHMVANYSVRMGLYPERVRITGAKTRWGSCSSKGNINFSWYLIMAAEEEIEYVVVHELAHLAEMNHSKSFWDMVEMYIPDYKDRRKKLKSLHQRLNMENWD